MGVWGEAPHRRQRSRIRQITLMTKVIMISSSLSRSKRFTTDTKVLLLLTCRTIAWLKIWDPSLSILVHKLALKELTKLGLLLGRICRPFGHGEREARRSSCPEYVCENPISNNWLIFMEAVLVHYLKLQAHTRFPDQRHSMLECMWWLQQRTC